MKEATDPYHLHLWPRLGRGAHRAPRLATRFYQYRWTASRVRIGGPNGKTVEYADGARVGIPLEGRRSQVGCVSFRRDGTQFAVGVVLTPTAFHRG